MSKKLPDEMTDEEWIKWESSLPMSELKHESTRTSILFF